MEVGDAGGAWEAWGAWDARADGKLARLELWAGSTWSPSLSITLVVIRGNAEFEDLRVETRFEYVKDSFPSDHFEIVWLGQPLINQPEKMTFCC